MPKIRRVIGLFPLLAALTALPARFDGADGGWVAPPGTDSLLEALHFANSSVFHFDFEKDATGGIRYVWLATADGLYRYDGFEQKRYDVKDGLPSNFIRCVLVTSKGELWVGTDKGAGVFSGSTFATRGSEQGLAGPYVRRIIEDREGSIWFASDSWLDRKAKGGLSRLRDGKWKSWNRKDGLPSDYVVDEFTDSSGRYFAMTIEGPARLKGERWAPEELGTLPAGSHWSSAGMVEVPDLGVVMSNGYSVWALEGDARWRPLGSPPNHPHGIASTRDGKILIAGDTKAATKAFFEWTGSEWQRVSNEFHASQGWGIYLREAPDGSIWYAGPGCLERWTRTASDWQFHRGPAGGYFLDANDRLWSQLSERQLTEFDGAGWTPRGNYNGYAVHRDGSLWAIRGATVTRWRSGRSTEFHEAETGLRDLLGVAIGGRGIVWVIGHGRDGKGAVSTYDGTKWAPRAVPNLGKLVRIAQSPGPAEGMWYLSQSPGDERHQLTFVGETIHDVPVPPAVDAYFVNSILATPDGDVLLYGETGAHRWKRANRQWETVPSLPARMVSSAAMLNGATWLALSGLLGGKDGLLRLAKDGSRRFFPTDPLTTALTRGTDGSLAAGGRGKFWVIPKDPGGEPAAVFLPDESQQVLSVMRDRKGVFWVGGPDGVSRFQPDGTPLRTAIAASNDKVLSGQPYIATAEAHSRFARDWVRGHFAYSWSIDGGPWSPFLPDPTRRIESNSLPIGTHTIAVRSRGNGMDNDPAPSVATFEVRPTPLQDQPWFGPGLLAATILMGVSTFTALSARRKLARKSAVSLDISERRYRQIIETAQEGVAVFDADGVCTMSNQEFARIVALPHDDVVGRHASAMLEGGVLEVIISRNFRAGAAGSHELPLQTRTGVRLLAMSGRPLPAFEGTPASTLVTFTDITAQRSAEDAIRRSELNYRTLFESSPNPRLMVNLETLQIVSLNKSACDLYGYTKEAFLRLSVLDLQLPENIEAVREQFSRALDSRPQHWRHRNSRGEMFPVEVHAHDHDFDGIPCRVVLIFDKTEQDRAADELRSSQAALAAAQRIAKIGSYEVRIAGANGETFERIWSDEMFHLTGLDRHTTSKEELHRYQMIHPEDKALLDVHIAKLLHDGTPLDAEHRIVRADGEVRYVRSTAQRSMRREQTTIIGTIQDITEYRMLQAQSQQSQRLDSIGRLAGGVAHDFNNLLTVINGYSKLILKRIEPGGRFHDEIQQIAEAGEGAAQLTRRLLAFGRKQVLKPTVLDLNEVVRGSIPLLTRVCDVDIRLVTNLCAAPVLVRADPVQVDQLLLNLTTNARDAMPRGGAFIIETSEAVLDAAFAATHPGSAPGRHCRLSLSDTGVGIDQASLGRVFEPFFTTKERSGGTGLGLATVYGIVKQSGGYISVSSEVGVGTRFDILLPALASSEKAAPAEVVPKPAGEPPLPRGTNRTLLLVEDQAEVRQFIAGVLVEGGYRVLQAANGRKALELYEGNCAQLDLLLTDVMMPGMTGPELARLITDRGRRANPLPVLFISGYAQGKLDSSLPSMEAAPILEKPFSPEKLLEKVREIVEKHPAAG